MAKKENVQSPKNIESNMGLFLKQLSSNVGFKFDPKNSKSSFNPYSVDNSYVICGLFVLMNSYSEKLNKKPVTPVGAISLPRNTGVKFEFNDELDTGLLSEIIEDQSFDNVEINSDRCITITKKPIQKE